MSFKVEFYHSCNSFVSLNIFKCIELHKLNQLINIIDCDILNQECQRNGYKLEDVIPSYIRNIPSLAIISRNGSADVYVLDPRFNDKNRTIKDMIMILFDHIINNKQYTIKKMERKLDKFPTRSSNSFLSSRQDEIMISGKGGGRSKPLSKILSQQNNNFPTSYNEIMISGKGGGRSKPLSDVISQRSINNNIQLSKHKSNKNDIIDFIKTTHGSDGKGLKQFDANMKS